ncbi:MAG: hypothetical protein MUP99_06970, partial [Pedobacter sp.]|nr:hypothetical protein [Pedobacter sp.]
LTAQLMSGGKSAAQAKQMAMGIMDGTLSVQSSMIAYSEGFMMIGIICAVILPLVFFARIKKGEVLTVEGGH